MVNVNGTTCEILDKIFEYTNKQKKIIENEYDSQIKDFRDIYQDERTKFIGKKLHKLAIK